MMARITRHPLVSRYTQDAPYGDLPLSYEELLFPHSSGSWPRVSVSSFYSDWLLALVMKAVADGLFLYHLLDFEN